ncbi:metalloregulator ArsR/SmtB family transcription factor [Thaumasiovibrio subtropicus]|uniref:metalloregulator ArsR/SmtB family transcription factor n=1 Tax=Thaumasiovibrio subtropicus TaxID=1891207 RepID=UPI000B35AEB8|nr:metalloregulator ArsR/SmtB family transcription factor [Thaumasiovibrio subtropicus]
MDPVTFYKCLSDLTRLKCILLIQAEKTLCVCELTEALAISQPKISRHLAQLRQCGLLQDERKGQWVFYQLSPNLPEWTRTVLTTTGAANQHLITDALEKLYQMGARPEREASCCN